MSAIPAALIDRVTQAADIVEVVGRRVALAGNRGKCPFHSDRERDLRVDPHRRRFNCVGCEASGDVVEFVRRFEGLAYADALRGLARQFRVELPEPLGEWPAEDQLRGADPPMPVFRITSAGSLVDVVVCPWLVIKIGRLGSSHLRLDDPRVARMHAVMEIVDDRVRVIDLGSAEGTFVNGQPVHRNKALALGDRLRFGDHELELIELVRPTDEIPQREAAQRSARIRLQLVEAGLAGGRLAEILAALRGAWGHVRDPAIERVAARLARQLGEPPPSWTRDDAPECRWLDAETRTWLDAIDRALIRLDVDAHGLSESALELAVLLDPADDEPRMVLADWLQQRGDPRGELIALQLADARGELDDDGRSRVAELLERHARAWSADFVAHGAEVEFRRGFPARVRYAERWSLELIDLVRRWTTIERVEGAKVPDVLVGC